MSPKKGHPVSYARCVFHRVFLYCGRISCTCIDRTAGFAQKNTAQGEFTLCGISFYSGLVFKFRICKVQITDGTQRGERALHFNANGGSAGNTQAQRACGAVHRERGNFILQMVVHINANRADKIIGGIALHDPCSRQALILSVRGVFGVDGFCDDRVQREVKAVAVRIAVFSFCRASFAISMMSSMLSPVTVFSKSSVKACSLDSLLFVILGSFPLSQ